MDSTEITGRFTATEVTEETKKRMDGVRNAIENAAHYINGEVPDSAEKTLAIRRLEEAVFWANRGLALAGRAQ